MSSRDATHYQGKVEVIDAIEDWGLQNNYNLANVVKYVARAHRKGDNPREHLIKARDYLERELTGSWPEPLPEPEDPNQLLLDGTWSMNAMHTMLGLPKLKSQTEDNTNLMSEEGEDDLWEL